MSKIKNIEAREILDSRGVPTVEVTLTTQNNVVKVASVPSGASTGSKEAIELRDNTERYCGKGVLNAVKNVNTIIKEALIGIEVANQKEIDQKMIELDGTKNKSNLGANAILGVSIACLKASAEEQNKELYQYLNSKEVKIPYGMFNIINGGKHANNNLDIQEFMIVPKQKSFNERLRVASEVFYSLKDLLKEKGFSTAIGDEGGFAPEELNNREALSIIVKSIEKAGYKPGEEVFIALDVAASSFYNKEMDKYNYDKSFKTREEMLELYSSLVEAYPIISIEDPFDENDYQGFIEITALLGDKINIVGDDLFVTNKEMLELGINKKMCNSILIKANQIGTFYEMLETIYLAKKNNYIPIISHRSGETNDNYISDFAVGLNIPFIKSGSVTRGERLAKYNRLTEIEKRLTNN